MTSQPGRLAREFHQATKLTYINLGNKPPLYKSYSNTPVVTLPSSGLDLSAPAIQAVAGPEGNPEHPFSTHTLANLLYFSAGVIRKAVLRQAGEVHYRAAASAGALYPIEAYVVCGDLPGLAAGVYHFAPANFALHQLRTGDYRGSLAAMSGNDETISRSPATIVFTSIFWRSTWKYRSRGYRYCFWDNGTVAANLMTTASAMGLPSRLVLGFIDPEVDRLLGIDGEHEASTCLVSVGRADPSIEARHILEVDELPNDGESAFENEIVYDDIRQTHAASRLLSLDEVGTWKGSLPSTPASTGGSPYQLQQLEQRDGAPRSLGQVITQRGSTRRFAREPMSFVQFSALLDHSTKGVPADFLDNARKSLLDLYLIVNAVEGLPAGAYFFSQERRVLELLREGDLREEAGHLCFEQALGADASAVAFILTDLERVLQRYGDRGYRAAQIEAGIIGGKLYLSAYSLGLGASGITFYDDEISEFFTPHSAGKEVMFVVTLGKTAAENRVRPFRSRVAVKLDALARGAGQTN